LLLWALPPTAVWLVAGGYDARLLSPAWPPLLLLAATGLSVALAGLTRKAVVLGALPLALVFVLALQNFYSLDGLNSFGWRDLRALGTRAFDPNVTQSIVLSDLIPGLDGVRSAVSKNGRIFTNDGRLSFYFPGRVTQYCPSGCGSLEGYSVFVSSDRVRERPVLAAVLPRP
jgi:hypothetical protein